MVTNTTPISAYRGAGRPEATAAIERAIDLFAAEIGMDPAEVRRRNLIPPEEFPYTTPTGAVYDTGDYVTALDKVLAAAGYASCAPSRPAAGRGAARSSSASGWPATWRSPRTLGRRRDGPAGGRRRRHGHRVHRQFRARPGPPHRLGHAGPTELGIPMDQVTVIHGDTDLIPEGVGTYASRSLQLGGVAVHKAALDVKDQARRVAADMIEAAEADLELDTRTGPGRCAVTRARASWADVAAHAGPDGLVALVSTSAGRPRSRSAATWRSSRSTPRPARPG